MQRKIRSYFGDVIEVRRSKESMRPVIEDVRVVMLKSEEEVNNEWTGYSEEFLNVREIEEN